MRASILGICCHLPEKVVTNDDLGRENPDWKMDKIYDKAGIWSRRVAAEDETAGDLGFQAAKKLLARRLVPVDQIDNSLERALGTDRDLHRQGLSSQALADALHGLPKVRPNAIHFVNKANARNAVAVRLTPNRL